MRLQTIIKYVFISNISYLNYSKLDEFKIEKLEI